MPFYRRENEALLSAPNFVHGPDINLTAENKDEHTYPVDGWYWFDDLDAALAGMANRIEGVVTMRQARLALHAADLLATVDAAIAQAGGEAQIEWEYATEVRRDSPLVANMTAALGLTAEQVDDLFRQASTL
jgi:hypothetical protein